MPPGGPGEAKGLPGPGPAEDVRGAACRGSRLLHLSLSEREMGPQGMRIRLACARLLHGYSNKSLIKGCDSKASKEAMMKLIVTGYRGSDLRASARARVCVCVCVCMGQVYIFASAVLFDSASAIHFAASGQRRQVPDN